VVRAQGNSQIDAKIAENRRFWTGTSLFGELLRPIWRAGLASADLGLMADRRKHSTERCAPGLP